MPGPVIFLDDGGVMNDNRRRGPQWQRLAGEFFAPILGGAPQAWAEANRIVTAAIFEPQAWRRRLLEASDYTSFQRAHQLDWLSAMCAFVGVACPSDEDGIELTGRANSWIIPRVDAAFPGAAEAIRTLHARGYTLHTASGESSAELAHYLDGMGVRACFGRLYGPDLIDALKVGPEYYRRILSDAVVVLAAAVVVDDSPDAIGWAMQVGARAVLVGAPSSEAHPTYHVGSLADLPGIIERL